MLARISRRLMPFLWLVSACVTACGDDRDSTTAEPTELTALTALTGPTGAVRFEQVTVTGPDCAPGTHRSQVSASGSAASITFDSLAAVLRSSDPENSAKYTDRARCAVSLRVAGEEGVSYALPVMHYEATSRPGRVGTLKFEISWVGEAKPQLSWGGLGGSLGGEHSLYELTWSSCTGPRELRIGLDLHLSKTMGEPWNAPEESIAVSKLAVPKLLVRRCDSASRPVATGTHRALPVRRISSPDCSVRSTVAEDGTATVSFTEVSVKLERYSKYSSREVRCSLDVEVDAPAGQSFTLESNEVAGSATLPAGYTATISRRVAGQAFATEDKLEKPYVDSFRFSDRYTADSPFVGEHGGMAACGTGKIRMQISLEIERQRGVSAAADAELRLGSLGPMKFVARACPPP